MAFQLHYAVARGIGARLNQEDEYSCIDNLTVGKGPAFFAVYDGHGGNNVSADASNHIYKDILESLTGGCVIEESIKGAFKEEEQHLQNFLDKLSADRAGSTATVAIVTRSKIHLGNVGDSRAVIGCLDTKGNLYAKRLSKDHHLDDPAERERVLKAGALVVEDRIFGSGLSINMTRALGDLNFKTPYNHASKDFISSDAHVSEPVALGPLVQFLVIATDGLWNVFNDDLAVVQKIDRLSSAGLTPEEIAKELVDICVHTPHSDNVTVIVVFFNWSGRRMWQKGSAVPGELLISKHHRANFVPKTPDLVNTPDTRT